MIFAAMIIAKIFVQVLKIPYSILGPTIIMLAAIGAFATKNIAIDVILMAVAGLVGFVLVICKLNSSALILGLVLGVICESNLRRASIIAPGDTLLSTLGAIISRPITGVVLLICLIVLLNPVLKPLVKKLGKR
jgi:putative tricarboxylic transport membrane protein